MKLEHRLKMWLGGPRIIMAEPGTNPLDEPHLYVQRRNSGGGWGMVLFWLLALAAVSGGLWWYATR